MNPIRVLLVDDNDEFLEGVTAWLMDGDLFDLVGKAHSGTTALEKVKRLAPELVLMDVAVSDMNGFETTRQIRMLPNSPAVILLTFHESQTARLEAWAAGAEGLIDKARVTEQLLSLIRHLFADRMPDRIGTKKDIRLPRHQGPPRDLSG